MDASEEASKEYRWETGYEKTWEAITEDSDGLLEVSVQEMLQRARRKRLLEKAGAKIKLGMMRHLYIVLDMSENMKQQDLKPSRLLCCTNLVEKFVEEFFHLNPISQLGIIVTRNKRAELISELTGNPRAHIGHVKKLAGKDGAGGAQFANSSCAGEPSLQNSLELALQTLRHMPAHATREVLVIMGSLTTCDPGDINKTIDTCKSANVRCSVISLAAEVRIYREVSKSTGGRFSVIMDDVHLRDLLHEHVEPPPSARGAEPALIKMGFPSHAAANSNLGLCMCHLDTTTGTKLSTSGFLCPQCQAKYCELPVECRACGLTLVSAPHLARSYHHLFPLPVFKEVPAKDATTQHCFSCTKTFESSEDVTLYECPECGRVFCSNCDIFIHETLHSCPGCSSSHQHQQQLATSASNRNGNHNNLNGFLSA